MVDIGRILYSNKAFYTAGIKNITTHTHTLYI